MLTRLLGRFALIFYLNCEHVLFVYILKQKQNKVPGFDSSARSRERTIVPQERRPALTIAVNVNKSSHIRFPICIVLIQLQWAVVLCTELICKLILLFIRSKDTKIVINIVPSALLIKKIKFKKNKKLLDGFRFQIYTGCPLNLAKF